MVRWDGVHQRQPESGIAWQRQMVLALLNFVSGCLCLDDFSMVKTMFAKLRYFKFLITHTMRHLNSHRKENYVYSFTKFARRGVVLGARGYGLDVFATRFGEIF